MAKRPIHNVDVEVGKVYVMKVSGKLAKVRITAQNKVPGKTNSPYSGLRNRRARTSWTGINLATGREVHIRSAAKLRLDITPESQSPICTCGADRTGPSAEAHDASCPDAAQVFPNSEEAVFATEADKQAAYDRRKEFQGGGNENGYN